MKQWLVYARTLVASVPYSISNQLYSDQLWISLKLNHVETAGSQENRGALPGIYVWLTGPAALLLYGRYSLARQWHFDAMSWKKCFAQVHCPQVQHVDVQNMVQTHTHTHTHLIRTGSSERSDGNWIPKCNTGYDVLMDEKSQETLTV